MGRVIWKNIQLLAKGRAIRKIMRSTRDFLCSGQIAEVKILGSNFEIPGEFHDRH